MTSLLPLQTYRFVQFLEFIGGRGSLVGFAFFMRRISAMSLLDELTSGSFIRSATVTSLTVGWVIISSARSMVSRLKYSANISTEKKHAVNE